MQASVINCVQVRMSFGPNGGYIYHLPRWTCEDGIKQGVIEGSRGYIRYSSRFEEVALKEVQATWAP